MKNFEIKDSSRRHLQALIIVYTLLGIGVGVGVLNYRIKPPTKIKEDVFEINLNVENPPISEKNAIKEKESINVPLIHRTKTAYYLHPKRKRMTTNQIFYQPQAKGDVSSEMPFTESPLGIEEKTDGFDEGSYNIEENQSNENLVWSEGDVEEPPSFRGGISKLTKWLTTYINYPSIALKNKIEGRVVIRFMIDKNGKVSDVVILQSLHPSCDREAIRAIQKMPRWIPGKQQGEPVCVYGTLPIVFKLQK